MKSITRVAALFVVITCGMPATGVASVGSTGVDARAAIEIVDADATSPQRSTDSPEAPAADRPVRPTVQGPAIPPVPMPVQRRPNKAAQREQKLKAKADALQAQHEQKLAEREQQAAQREQKLKAKADALRAQREQKLKAKVDALQAELDALTSSRK